MSLEMGNTLMVVVAALAQLISDQEEAEIEAFLLTGERRFLFLEEEPLRLGKGGEAQEGSSETPSTENPQHLFHRILFPGKGTQIQLFPLINAELLP